MTTAPLKTFIIYAREDRDALLELKKQLIPLQRRGQLSIWDDGEIIAGQEWETAITDNLKKAELILLLLSSDFFASDYIEKKELKAALLRHEQGKSIVVPVIVRHCIWQEHPEIEKLQVLPEGAAPVYSKKHWDGLDEAFANVAQGIARIAKSRMETSQRSEQAAVKAQDNKIATALLTGLPEMILVKGGTFQMGSKENGDEKPAHPVTLSDFEIGKYPVTQKLWRDITGKNPTYFKTNEHCPVENISWDDIQTFLRKLNARFPGKKYRLPTEAEWEFAARGGNRSKGYMYAGSNDLKEVAWYWENADSQTHSVGEKKPNELGLFDMSGNLWEWCADWYGPYPATPQTNPAGPDKGSHRVARGGSWISDEQNSRISYRNGGTPDYQNSDLGFRLASSPQ